MRDGHRDLFMDTGAVMTKELYDKSVKGGLYVKEGKLKVKIFTLLISFIRFAYVFFQDIRAQAF